MMKESFGWKPTIIGGRYHLCDIFKRENELIDLISGGLGGVVLYTKEAIEVNNRRGKKKQRQTS